MHRDSYQRSINEAYIQALFFTECGPDSGIPADSELSPAALAKCNSDCCDFVDLLVNERIFKKALDVMTPEQIGHDFWLTRNGHGAGFWDRGHGALGDTLTQWAKTYSSVCTEYGDDGFIHIM